MSNVDPLISLVGRSTGGPNSRHGLFDRAAHRERRPALRLQAQGTVQAAVVFNQSGTAFIADLAGGVQAYTPNGKLLWRVKVEGGISAAPVVTADNALLLVGTHHGYVFGLDAASGATRWRQEIPSQSDPRILSDLLHLTRADLVVFSSWGGRFHALDARTGQERFNLDAGISPRAAAASDKDENIYYLRALSGHGVEFVRINTHGQERVLLRQPEDTRGARRALVAAAPILDESRAMAYIIANQVRGGELLAWSLESESVLWRQSLSATAQATPTVLKGGEVILADMAGSVHGFSFTSAPIFHYATGSEYLLAGGVGRADGTFYIGDPLGMVYRITNQGTGDILFEAPRSLQTRLSFGPFGRLYVPCTDRFVYVFTV